MKYVIMLFVILSVSCGRECKNFDIKKAYLQPAKLVGIDSTKNDTSTYVLLNFDLEFVNCTSVFMGGGIEAGLQGINGSITNLIISDSNNVDITGKFVGARFRGDLIKETSDSMSEVSFFTNSNLQELKNNINLHRRNESGNRLKFLRPFTIPKNIKWPLTFKMYFNNSDSIVQKFEYKENDVKTYEIQ